MNAEDLTGAAAGELSLHDAAKLFGKNPWTFRRELQTLHEQHGNVLWRYSEAPNAKQWTSLAALRRVLPGMFDIEVSPLTVLELRQEVIEQGRRLARVERALAGAGGLKK
jgi:hypothetical protein